ADDSRHRADEPPNDPPSAKPLPRRDARDPKRLRPRRRLVDVHLGQDERPSMLLDEPFQQRPEGPAWSAPWRPEVDHHGCDLRPLQDGGLEVGISGFDDPFALTHGTQPCARLGAKTSPPPEPALVPAPAGWRVSLGAIVQQTVAN